MYIKSWTARHNQAPVSVTRVNGGQEYIVNDGLKEGDIIVAEGVACCVKVLRLK